MNRNFTSEDVIKLYENKEKIGSGAFGTVKQIDYFTLIKTYMSDTRDVNTILIPSTFDKLKREETEKKNKGFYNMTREERILNAKKHLSFTKYGRDLIKGLAYYHEYAFGTLLTYYRNYIELGKINNDFNNEEKREICHNLDLLMDDFFKNYIYPLDIKGSNIMVNPNTLETKMIDLEDKCVYYLDEYDDKKEATSKARMDTVKKKILSDKRVII